MAPRSASSASREGEPSRIAQSASSQKRRRKSSAIGKEPRRPNFTSGEIEKLKSQYFQRKSILKAKFSATVTHQVKLRQWKQITVEINKVGTHNRTHEEVKRKWENLQCEIKGKLAAEYSVKDRVRTGGGGPSGHNPTPEDERMLSIIGKTAVFGIEGGIDSSQAPGPSRIIQELVPIVETESDLEELQDIEVVNHSEIEVDAEATNQPVRDYGNSESGSAQPSGTGRQKPKTMAERILAAQEELCSTLQNTNRLLKNSIDNHKTSFETLTSKFDALIELKQKELQLIQMRMEWEVENK